MSDIGISILKRTAFRGSTQEFSNHYFYRSNLALPDNALAGALIDEIVLTERDLHSTLVTFVMGRLWSHGLGAVNNQMILERPLSGTGNQATVTSFDKERAVLVRWPAGVDNRGRPVYLRKWYHSCGNCAGTAFGSGQLDNTAEINFAGLTAIQNKAAEIGVIGATSAWNLMAPSGRQFDGNQPQAHKFLEHRQFGDQWRG